VNHELKSRIAHHYGKRVASCVVRQNTADLLARHDKQDLVSAPSNRICVDNCALIQSGFLAGHEAVISDLLLRSSSENKAIYLFIYSATPPLLAPNPSAL